ncbi:hypothetical protein [Caballeronia sp. Lep1P3]|uniref:hypothetical protein n=1 Tax=Caballeronia sp. Lep1P3 TaxID=2878150 RepID=UPI001FD51050|nr:hypothetical protein [Caballeronia sp. Lep1P3]
MIKRTLVYVASCALGSGTAGAQEVFTQAGTQGIGIGAAYSLGPRFGVHADFNGIDFHHDIFLGGNRYKDDARLRQGGVYLDYFPLEHRGWRITAGVRFNDDSIEAVSSPDNGTYSFDGKRYPAPPGATATATAKYPLAMPYFGIGFGHKPQGKGFGFIADIGVAYGEPRTSYTLSPSLSEMVGPAQSATLVSTGEREVRDKAWRFRWYPVGQIGISYRF